MPSALTVESGTRLRALMLLSNPCVYFELGVTDWQWNNTVPQKGNAVVISSDPKGITLMGLLWQNVNRIIQLKQPGLVS
jgi:hypothetical protein